MDFMLQLPGCIPGLLFLQSPAWAEVLLNRQLEIGEIQGVGIKRQGLIEIQGIWNR